MLGPLEPVCLAKFLPEIFAARNSLLRGCRLMNSLFGWILWWIFEYWGAFFEWFSSFLVKFVFFFQFFIINIHQYQIRRRLFCIWHSSNILDKAKTLFNENGMESNVVIKTNRGEATSLIQSNLWLMIHSPLFYHLAIDSYVFNSRQTNEPYNNSCIG